MVTRKILSITFCAAAMLTLMTTNPTTSFAQATKCVVGVVQSTKKEPLKEVRVAEVRHQDKTTDTTNANGLYCIKVSADSYQLQFEKAGFLTYVDIEPRPNNADPNKRETLTMISIQDISAMISTQPYKLQLVNSLVEREGVTITVGIKYDNRDVIEASRNNLIELHSLVITFPDMGYDDPEYLKEILNKMLLYTQIANQAIQRINQGEK